MKLINIKNGLCFLQEAKARHEHSRFLIYFESYLKGYTRKDIRVIKQAYDRYRLFLSTQEDPKAFCLNAENIRRFAVFLMNISKGCGAHSTFCRFKKVVSSALENGVIKSNPCINISCGHGGDSLTKDIVSEEEMRLLFKTRHADMFPDIRNAFIFCLYTGLRFCDIKSLRYSNIDYRNLIVSLDQAKTKDRSSCSRVHIPIRRDLLELTRHQDGKSMDGFVFNLPSHTTCLKHLSLWTAEAGLDKHITWHCARHSFATNLLIKGADIKVVAELLGHSSLRHVDKYVRAVDKMKIRAIESLPPII